MLDVLAYFASVGAAWMPAVVRALVSGFPDLRLHLSLRDELPANPSQRSDIQLIVDQAGAAPIAGVRTHHLLVDPYVAVVPVGHPLAGVGPVELSRLADEQWVDNDVMRGWCRGNLIEACRAAGFSPPFYIEAHDYPTAISFVDAGAGLTVLPRLAARNLPPGVVVVPVTGPTPLRSIYLLVRTAIEHTAPARTAIEVLRQRAQASTPDIAYEH